MSKKKKKKTRLNLCNTFVWLHNYIIQNISYNVQTQRLLEATEHFAQSPVAASGRGGQLTD